ncbi:MAG: cell division protein FtsX [Minisyncoccota bacterium]
MFVLNFKRIWKSGFVNFWRNGVVSLSAVLVMVVALSMIGSTILFSAVLQDALTTLKSKVDVNVYFTEDATDTEIQAFLAGIKALSEVAQVDYISRDQALADFQNRHAGDDLILQALNEVGGNPLLPYANIHAKDPSQYAQITQSIQTPGALVPGGRDIVYKVYSEEERNQAIIARLSQAIAGFHKVGLGIIIILLCIAALITFNTIRLTIYTAREEISVMRLVGAENGYVRGPFIAEGVIYGFIAGIITLLMFAPLTYWVSRTTAAYWQGIDLFHYYGVNFAEVAAIVLGSGVALGAISSYLAVRRYLKL